MLIGEIHQEKKKKKQRKLAMIVPFSCLKIKNKDVTPPLTT